MENKERCSAWAEEEKHAKQYPAVLVLKRRLLSPVHLENQLNNKIQMGITSIIQHGGAPLVQRH